MLICIVRLLLDCEYTVSKCATKTGWRDIEPRFNEGSLDVEAVKAIAGRKWLNSGKKQVEHYSHRQRGVQLDVSYFLSRFGN